MGTASYPEEENIFPNRPHWLPNGIDFVSARYDPPVCWCPENAIQEKNLCQGCRDIRLRHLIFCEAEGRMVSLDELGEIMKRNDCHLCSLITLACKQILGEKDRFGQSLGSQKLCHILGLDVSKQQSRGYALTVSVDWQWLEFEMIYKGNASIGKPVDRVLESHPKVNMSFLKTMLEGCNENHPGCRDMTKVATPPQMCIIDLNTMSIGPAPAECKYTALSYVWGKITEKWLTLTRENAMLLREKNSLRNAHLPRTIRDAMQMCQDLGQRYLWVDSLCIVQNDTEFQKQQIDIMDEIYASASFTIVAAAGDNADSGLPGVNMWSREVQRQIITIQDVEVSNAVPRLKATAERSPWNTRGWTYQEQMFSRRAIFLTEVQAFFACSMGVEYELKDRLLPNTYPVERFQNLASQQQLSEHKRPLMVAYSKSVTEYTIRSLTNQADILRAFVGVTNNMARHCGQPFFYGLPSSDFDAALLWQPSGQTLLRNISDVVLPSWSWASCQGAIKYTFVEHIIDREATLPKPGFWPDGQEPNNFDIDWLLNENGKDLVRIKKSSLDLGGSQETPETALSTSPKAPEIYEQLALQELGRLLFSAQCLILSLKDSVPFVTADSWWTDYTTSVNLSSISMLSICSRVSDEEPIGFMEMDKKWVKTQLSGVAARQEWEFVALSLAAMDKDDFMHRHFTMRRNIGYPLVWSRNVRELIVNVMLVERVGDVVSRLGVGKIYLDYWEREMPSTKWMILE